MSMRGKYKALSVKEKLAIIDEVESGVKKTAVALKYGITKSTLTTIVKAKDKLREKASKFAPDRKRLREAAHPQLEDALLLWLKRAWSSNPPISGPILREKADELASRMDLEAFKCSDGWISRFKERHGMAFKTVSGEVAAVNLGVVRNWQQTRLQCLLREYAPSDVYNADEMGLFYKCLPSQTLCRRGERCTGGKLSRERVTVMVCANMDGSHKPELFVIGKAKRPTCFKGIRTLPVTYASNTRAWMTQALFEKWLRKLDNEFKRAKRKVLFVVDNCPAHGHVEGLEAIQLEFLPPNTTAALQPLDQGVIKNLKVYYRKHFLQRMLLCMDNDKPYTITLLTAIGMLSDAWDSVTANTIKNCFRHAAFTPDGTETAPGRDDQEEIENEQLTGIMLSGLEAHDVNARLPDYAGLDDDVCVCRDDTLEDIIQEVMPAQCSSDSEDEDEEGDDPHPTVTAAGAFKHIAQLRRFLSAKDESRKERLALAGIENCFEGSCAD